MRLLESTTVAHVRGWCIATAGTGRCASAAPGSSGGVRVRRARCRMSDANGTGSGRGSIREALLACNTEHDFDMPCRQSPAARARRATRALESMVKKIKERVGE